MKIFRISRRTFLFSSILVLYDKGAHMIYHYISKRVAIYISQEIYYRI